MLAILEAGINVVTTLNVQHLEPVAERVEAMVGIPVRERLPGSVLNRADQVVNVDVTKEELRLNACGRASLRPGTGRAGAEQFFSNSIRTCRCCARCACALGRSGPQDRGKFDLLSRQDSGDMVEAVMVGVSSDPTDAEILIRKGMRIAGQFGSPCYVVCVRRPSEKPTRIDAGLQRVLQNNLRLAALLGRGGSA